MMTELGAREIVIRTDASRAIGTGHVMRCLALARTLRECGAEVRFVCREHEDNLNHLVEAAEFVVCRLAREDATNQDADAQATAHAHWLGASWQRDADQTLAAIGEHRADWLIVDHYALDSRWQRRLRAKANKILVIDDLADRQHDCDVLLDQNFFSSAGERYEARVSHNTTLLLGPSYALLGSDYAQLRRRVLPRRGVPKRLLVSFGGADRIGLTRLTVEALMAIDHNNFAADIILSQKSDDYYAIKRSLASNSHIHLHDRVASLGPFMLAADFAIGASGATHWERMCLGVPTLVVTMADNQREVAQHLANSGLIHWLGDADTVGVDELRAAIEKVMRDGLDPAWSIQCMNVVDGRGTERVVAVLEAGPNMNLVVRHCDLGDEDLLLEWANDPVTRANSYSPHPISREDHLRWYRGRLRDPLACKLFIAETVTGVPVGHVRFDKRDEEWEISYAVAPVFRSRGVGRPMLDASLRKLARSSCTVIGQVRPDNIPSRRIFEALGFALRSSAVDRLIFERLPQN